MAEVRRQLAYKTQWYGSRLVVADRWFPSSKTCSGCGWRNPSLKLSDRTFTCAECGLVLDRDLNAAVNLRNLVAASAVETENARGVFLAFEAARSGLKFSAVAGSGEAVAA
jgi:putative transposase